MVEPYNVTIKFIDGERLDISGVTGYGINSATSPKYAFVEVNKNRLFFNFSTVKYIGKSLDLKQEE